VRDNYKQELEVNFVATSLDVFILYYNRTIPAAFPQATPEALKHFQSTHPTLFDEGNLWVIDKHRKRLMDWLISYRQVV